MMDVACPRDWKCAGSFSCDAWSMAGCQSGPSVQNPGVSRKTMQEQDNAIGKGLEFVMLPGLVVCGVFLGGIRSVADSDCVCEPQKKKILECSTDVQESVQQVLIYLNFPHVLWQRQRKQQ